jgi:hypothetical protein
MTQGARAHVFHRLRPAAAALLLLAGSLAAGCQKPTDPDDTIDYDEVIDVTTSPNPVIADTDTGGKTYRVVRGNNQPDEILPYDWHAVFSVATSFNNQATDDDVDIDFPVKITATTLSVKQASGGIITPPTGGETEKSEYVVVGVSNNEYSGVNSPINITFELWYDLPSLRREAVVQIAFSFSDRDGTTFTKQVDARVAP